MENASPRQCLIFDPGHESPGLAGSLTALGYRVTNAAQPDTALRAVIPTPHQLAFVAVRAGDPGSAKLISSMLSACHGLVVIAVVRPGDVAAALDAGRRGARFCVASPVTFADVDRVLESLAPDAHVSTDDARTSSPLMRTTVNATLKAAPASVPVLFRAEPGAGQDGLARQLHEQSPRANGPFVAVSCAAFPEGKLAFVLFGGKNGSARAGRIEAANAGSLFLDEIGELSSELQARLLRHLEAGSLQPTDDAGAQGADVRVVASTSRDLATRFNPELYRRLSVVTIDVPPLRERPEDMLPLVRNKLAAIASRMGRIVPELSPDACSALHTYTWPGNLTELENELERAMIMTPGNVLESSAFSDKVRPVMRAMPYVGGDFTIEEIERAHIERVLARSRTFDGAAQLLGIDDSTLWRKRKRYADGAINA